MISAVKKMSALGVAVIYVSHRMEEIRRIASCATVMRDGQVAGDVMLENTSTHHIVSLMLGRDHVDIAPVAPQEIVDQAVLEVRALRHKPKLEDISFTLRRGEVLGIAGLLGAGRSELLKAIVGLEEYEQGEIVINGEKITRPDYGDMLKRGIGYTPENRKEVGIIPWLGVDENTVLTNRQKISANGVLQWSTIRRLTEEVMQRMTVKAASSETPIGTLSGGNQQKVVIGRWVYAASQILLLDSLNAPGFISLNNQMISKPNSRFTVLSASWLPKEKAWCLSPVKWRSCRWCVTASCYYSTARSRRSFTLRSMWMS